MAFLNESGQLVTQGDGELATVCASLGLVAESANLLLSEPDKVKILKSMCAKLSGKAAMLFMLTPFDPEDSAPVDRNPQCGDVSRAVSDVIPEFGRAEHQFSSTETQLILGSLRYRCDREPIGEREEKTVSQASIILEQVGQAEY